jgi:NAD(P)-dependent dehydrogenase (short-subunit alcohol dehydrogenase family)
MGRYDSTTTTDEVLEGIDLSGKRVVITGTSSGLGEESTRALASKGAAVTMAARTAEKNEAAAARILAKVPGADLEQRALDLTSLASVRAFASGFLADHDRIDILINNAGVMCCPHGVTEDGFEMQLGTNHLGHFLLTGRLAPAFGEGTRVVELSSGAHGMSDFDFDDPMFERRGYDTWLAYGQSKTANSLFAVELDRRLRSRGAAAYAVHPGVIMTELSRHFTQETLEQMGVMMKKRAEDAGREFDPAVPLPVKSVEAGAATQVWAATAPELTDHGGAYLADCQIAQVGADVSGAGVEAYALDSDAAVRLWALSEELVGEKLDV